MLCPPPGGRHELEGAPATVLVGELARLESPARRNTEHLGVELTPRRPGILVPLYDDHEHALVAAVVTRAD